MVGHPEKQQVLDSLEKMDESMDAKKMYTAIISDLHLTESEPSDARRPYWKKYKSKEFFFDQDFALFLIHLNERSQGQPVELILNGDIFDFDAVMSLPQNPPFFISWIEKKAGLFPRPERARFKMEKIIKEHPIFFQALRDFILRGNRVVFTIGNHDVELHFDEVREVLIRALDLTIVEQDRILIVPWFYISQGDTLVEHGNQYDPYCVFEDPIHPFVYGRNYKTLLLPFGDMTCRYLVNGMGYFNPHVDSNFIMDLKGYVKFFFKYVVKTQPFLLWTWFWRSVVTLYFILYEKFTYEKPPHKDWKQRLEKIAEVSQADPFQVMALKELAVNSATRNPWLLFQELWIDRALFFLLGLGVAFQLMVLIKQFIYDISIWWAVVPLMLLAPFFIFYSQFVFSRVETYKEPNDQLLYKAAKICGVSRIVHGHIHEVRHELRGSVEYLNSGTWSPAFTNVECTEGAQIKSFVWIAPNGSSGRIARVLVFEGRFGKDIFGVRRDLAFRVIESEVE